MTACYSVATDSSGSFALTDSSGSCWECVLGVVIETMEEVSVCVCALRRTDYEFRF